MNCELQKGESACDAVAKAAGLNLSYSTVEIGLEAAATARKRALRDDPRGAARWDMTFSRAAWRSWARHRGTVSARRLNHTSAAEQMMCAANLHWQVQKEPAPGARLLAPGHIYDRYIVLRDPVDDETEAVALAIVSKEYEPLQNVDAFTFFEPFIDNGWAEFHTAGALGNGERVWALARLSEHMVIHGDDPIDRFLLLSNSHDGSSAVTVRFTPVRVVCQNTLSLAQADGTGVVSVRHTRNIRHNLKKTQAQALKRLSDAVFARGRSPVRLHGRV